MSDLGARSWRSVAWRVALPVLVFAGSTTVVMTLRFSWTPRADSDRWAVAMVVAVFLSGLAVSAFEWVRGSSSTPGTDPTSADRQEVTAGRDSENIVARGDIGAAGTGSAKQAGGAARSACEVRPPQPEHRGRRKRRAPAGGEGVAAGG